MREKIPAMGEHPVCSTPAAGPPWTPLHISHLSTSVQVLIFTAFHFHHMRTPLLLSTPLFTHLPPITSHQNVLGEFISVYNML